MRFPDRQASKGTPYEPAWQTPPHWPSHVHLITMDQMDGLGIDLENNLYWDGVPIVTKQTVRLEGWSLFLAALAAAATVVSALWPIGVHLHWW